MNRREHLIQRIEQARRRVSDTKVRRVLDDAQRVLEADEDDITQLTQRVDWLERETERRMPLVNEDVEAMMRQMRPG
jgi:hypothetical protein